MKPLLAFGLCVCWVCFQAAAQPGIQTIVQTEDNLTREITIESNETLEILMAYDFYGAGSGLVIKRGKARFQVIPGNAAGGLPHCTPHPFVVAGPVVLSVESGNTQGARTEATPLVVTLEVKRNLKTAAPAKPPPASPAPAAPGTS
jgi:hypothetical protein